MSNLYDEDYFERGIETGKSGYRNYRWLPELTIPMAMSMIDYLELSRQDRILDFGCAKGYVVKALRLLYRQAWGCDVSEYAVNSSDNETRQYLEVCPEGVLVPFDGVFDVIIAKDVLEHVDEEDVDYVLEGLSRKGLRMFAVIPLGKEERYIIPSYENDITHKLRKDPKWWIDVFERNNWILEDFSFYVPGIKESWSNFKEGNGFFLVSREGEQ
jgi:SAM-dependent methyltransferase